MAFAVAGELHPPFRFSPLLPFNSPTRTFTLSTSLPTPKFINTQYFTQKRNGNCSIIANSSIISPPIVSPDDLWGIWMSLFATGSFGLWLEKTKIGSMISAALISTLVGLNGSNMGIIPYEAPTYSVVLKYPLPLTIPLLLFRENLRHVLHSTGPLLLAFLLASAGMIIGSVVAYLMVPMRSLGQDSWKITTALMGSYIGGTTNYVAICDALGVSPSVMAAGVAADNVICAIYFTALFSLASKITSEASTSSGVILIAVVSASGVLFYPYVNFVLHQLFVFFG